jgi:hypothetical protein
MNDLVLIVSVINTGKVAWSYTKTRSTYSSEERYNQSLQTIDSIRKYLPGAQILFVECSEIPDEYTRTLLSKVDYFLNQYEIDEARDACIKSNNKGLGEATQTKLAIEYIIKNNLTFNRLFKISGRYFLTDKFVSDRYRTDCYTFKKRANTGNSIISISTVVYSFPMPFLHHFYSCVCAVVEYYKIHGPRGYEEVLPVTCEPRNEIEIIGAAGLVAVNDEYFTC